MKEPLMPRPPAMSSLNKSQLSVAEKTKRTLAELEWQRYDLAQKAIKKDREIARKMKAYEKGLSPYQLRQKERSHKLIIVGAQVLRVAKDHDGVRQALIFALEGIEKEDDRLDVAELLTELRKEAARG